MSPRRRDGAGVGEEPLDLFSFGGSHTLYQLDSLPWPAINQFLVNRSQARVGDSVVADLVRSNRPLVVAGFAGIAKIVDVVDAWNAASAPDGVFRLVLGSEPFGSTRASFGSPFESFDDEVQRYWLEERGVSLALSAKLIRTIDAIDAGRLVTRAVMGTARLHAKIFVSDTSATIGSSNFTDAGLRTQLEANVRFDGQTHRDDVRAAAQVAENYWYVATPWDRQIRALLDAMLRVVSWREALARACADLLEGEWASRYLDHLESVSSTTLWPSQRSGIAEALWVIDTVGSVLVADATGSGKTRMGAQLVRAVRDRMLSTGRTRNELMVLVCPPAVQAVWEREALGCGLNLQIASHGKLSRGVADGDRVEAIAVAQAQVLAVDEAHNFLNPQSNRTILLRGSLADHVALFTATPINRGASDLLALVDLLGADNVDDETLAVLTRLDRARNVGRDALPEADVAVLRRAIGRFTVRRTKRALNELVAREPDAYLDRVTDRIARYPNHDAKTYATGETDADAAIAQEIRRLTKSMLGLAFLERTIAVPDSLRTEYTDQRWLDFRLASVPGLAAHQILSALRSSRAALIEHVAGTEMAVAEGGLVGFKTTSTGNIRDKVVGLSTEAPPTVQVACVVPAWLTEPASWAEACAQELAVYDQVLHATLQISPARESAKANLLVELGHAHERLLAFDSHLITLEVIRRHIELGESEGVLVLVATGADSEHTKRRFTMSFARTSTAKAIGLCSDAMNEGINLQGASAIVHLDLPTTLRVAEQRVGRVDRMDSPHDEIQAWWPDDGPAFTTAANDLLARRTAASDALLGANVPVPAFGSSSASIRSVIESVDQPDLIDWDGLHDALSPVRDLIGLPSGLLTSEDYELHRRTRHRVLAHVAPVASISPWMLLAVTSTTRGAPRWILCDGLDADPLVDLGDVCLGLCRLLADDPPNRLVDNTAVEWMEQFIARAQIAERRLMPRRLQRALDQVHTVANAWAIAAARRGDEGNAQMLRALSRLSLGPGREDTVGGLEEIDPYALAQRWIDIIRPRLDARRRKSRRRYQLLSDITKDLLVNPIDPDVIRQALAELPLRQPLADRISAAIIGVPDPVGVVEN